SRATTAPVTTTPAATTPTNAAPSSSPIPAMVKTPAASKVSVMPSGPSRLTWPLPVVRYAKMVASTCGPRRGSAPGGMISGSNRGRSTFGTDCSGITPLLAVGLRRPLSEHGAVVRRIEDGGVHTDRLTPRDGARKIAETATGQPRHAYQDPPDRSVLC